MKYLPLLATTLAIPAAVAFAQTPAPGTTGGQIPYIPLIGSGGGTNGTTGNSTWFIDVARNHVVLCIQSGTEAQNFTCTAQPVPPGDTPPPGGGAPASGGETPPATDTGGAGANPLGG